MVEWRPCPLDDARLIGAVSRLAVRFYAEDLHVPMCEEKARSMLDKLAGSPQFGTVYVAEASGSPAPVGYALVMRYLSNEFGGFVAYLDEFYLLPEYQGSGAGTRFLDGLAKLATSRGETALWLEADPDNTRAQRLYRRHGFDISPRLLMRKPLDGALTKPLPDIIDFGLDVLIVGYNPGLRSAEIGHHFAGRSSRFWRLLHESGLTATLVKAESDRSLLALGIGITNLADRPTREAKELTPEDFAAGRDQLRRTIETFRPRFAAHVGKDVYRHYAGVKNEVAWGEQPRRIVPGVIDFVLPNPSGLNRMPFDEQLKYYRSLAVRRSELSSSQG